VTQDIACLQKANSVLTTRLLELEEEVKSLRKEQDSIKKVDIGKES
jgi:cell division protein FtsB